jgi:hypothetical protein
VQECSLFGSILKQSTHKSPHTADRLALPEKEPLSESLIVPSWRVSGPWTAETP